MDAAPQVLFRGAPLLKNFDLVGNQRGSSMLVKQIMSDPLNVCHISDNLHQAARKMWEGDCGVVPIVDGEGRVVAMLTDRDICMASYTQGKPLHEIPVTSAMSQELFSCSPGDTLEQAERLMRDYRVRRLPVIDLSNKLVGILSLNDVARAAARQHHYVTGGSLTEARLTSVARTVAAISAPRISAADPKTA